MVSVFSFLMLLVIPRACREVSSSEEKDVEAGKRGSCDYSWYMLERWSMYTFLQDDWFAV